MKGPNHYRQAATVRLERYAAHLYPLTLTWRSVDGSETATVRCGVRPVTVRERGSLLLRWSSLELGTETTWVDVHPADWPRRPVSGWTAELSDGRLIELLDYNDVAVQMPVARGLAVLR